MARNPSALENINSLLGITQAIKGQATSKSGSSSGSSTTQGNLTEEGAQRIIDKMLAGSGGVKDISGAARGAGLYNSSTEAMLTNDLIARTAGEVAERQAGTTTTENRTFNETMETPGVGVGGALLPMAAMSIARPLLGKLAGVGGSTASGAAAGAGLASAGGDMLTSLFSEGIGGNAANNFLGGGLSNAFDNIAIGSNVGASLGTTIGDAGAGIMGDAAGFMSGIPGVGQFLGGLLGGGDPSDMSGFGLGASALAGLASMGPVGLLAGPAMNMLGSALGGMSVVCTALQQKGLLDKELYDKGKEYLEAMDEDTRNGYMRMFLSIALKIEEGSKFWSYVCLPFARGRTKLLASNSKVKHLKHPIGSITKFIGEPICKAYGKYLRSKQFKLIKE